MKSVKDWLDEGVGYFNVGYYQQALMAFEVAISLDRKLAFAYYCKGRALSKLNRDAEAITFLREALRLEPNVTVPYIEIAEILDRQGKTKESQQLWDKVHQLGYREYHYEG